jgi:hypothetical protein
MITALDSAPRGWVVDNDVEILERRARIISLRSQRYSMPQIAAACGISVSQVQQDLRYIRAEWQRKVARNRAVWMADVLQDIEDVRSLAIDSFLKSDQPTREKSVETSEKGTKSRRARKTRQRDPRFLAIALECDKQRAAILGLGDKAAVERVDEMLGKKRPKLLVVRDRAQASQLVDVSKLLELEFAKPETAQEDTVDGMVLSTDGGEAVSDAAVGDKPQDTV